MIENLIINGIIIYFLGLLLSSLVALLQGSFKKATFIFILANIFGFASGATYLYFLPNQNLTLGSFDWFFNFTPRLSLLAGIFFTVISLVSALVGVYSLRYLELYKKTYNPGTVQALMAIFVLGMQGVLLANNAFGFLFFWEVMSITSFFLVLVDKTTESLNAAFLYFIMTHLGASALMGGFLILSHGSLIFDLQNIAIASQRLSPLMLAATFGLFLFGFGSKAGLVPFHVWLPEAHPQAPSNVSAMMSGLMLKVAIYGFIAVVFHLTNLPAWAGLIVIFLGLLSGMFGVLYALIEKDLKRIFAYSSIENMGIIFTMLGLALYLFSKNQSHEVLFIASTIMAFAIFHALCHMFFKTALFLSSGVIINRVHSKSLELMGGLARLLPVFSLAFMLAILGSLPLAPFGTFYGEWGFIQSIVHLFNTAIILSANEIIVFLIILTLIGLISGLAVFAMIRVFGISMLGLSRVQHLNTEPEKNDRLLVWPIFGLIASLLILGIFAKTVLAWLTTHLNLQAASVRTTKVVGGFSSLLVFAAFVSIFLIILLVKKIAISKNKERIYHTWDCGQPITAGMEYTATAFSAPIRFFFLRFLGSVKMVSSVPIVATNPWIKKYNFSLTITSVWKRKLYQPIASFFIFLAHRAKKVQSGRLQYYLIFLLLTLIITLMIAL